MSDWIGIDVSGIEGLQSLLAETPEAVGSAAVDEVNKYLLNVLKTYPPYRHIGFKQAYGGWFSDKQRRYVMARIREGSITPGYAHRSQHMAGGWKVIDKGMSSIIVNEVPYSGYLMGDRTQSRMAGLIGWDRITFIIRERMPQIIRRATAGVKNALKKLGF
jgi:hypothetical protein